MTEGINRPGLEIERRTLVHVDDDDQPRCSGGRNESLLCQFPNGLSIHVIMHSYRQQSVQ